MIVDRSLCVSRSVTSDSLRSHGVSPTRLLHPCDSPGKNTGVGYHFLLLGIFPTQGSNPGLLLYRQILYHLSHQGSPRKGFFKKRKASLMAPQGKNLLAMQKTQEAGVPSLGWEDTLEKGMVTHSRIFAWRIPWTEEPGRLQSTGSQRVGHD